MAQQNKKQVMDVAKPGKTPANATSRPVIVSNSAVVQDASVVQDPDATAAEMSETKQSLRTHTKVVSPIVIEDDTEDQDDSPKQEAEEKPADSEEVKKDTPAEDKKTSQDDEPLDNSSAIVDAVIDEVASQKDKAQQNKEAVRADAVSKLVESKEYFLPIKQVNTQRGSKKPALVALLLLVATIVGLYALVDVGAIKPGFEVPFHVLGDKQQPVVTSTPPAATSTPAVAKSEPVAKTVSKSYSSAVLGLTFSYPDTWGEVSESQSNLNVSGTESVKTNFVTFSKNTKLVVRVTPTSWKYTGTPVAAISPMTDVIFTSRLNAKAAPYLLLKNSTDSYSLLEYSASEETVTFKAAKKLVMKKPVSSYIEVEWAPVSAAKAGCTTASKDATGATSKLPTKSCYSEADITDIQSFVDSLKLL